MKKLRAFFNRPKYIVTNPLAHPCIVEEIYPDAKSFGEALGIPPEREDVLEMKAHTLIAKGLTMGECAAELSKECHHANELALVSYHLGHCPAVQIQNMRNMQRKASQ